MISLQELAWTKLSDLRNCDPKSICTQSAVPRLARDETYAIDIIKAWKNDFSATSTRDSSETLGAAFPYKGEDGTEYAGYLVVPSTVPVDVRSSDILSEKLPVVVLFHTGAGPQDIFNRFKADQLAREKCWGKKGCIIFIADILSDSTGWAWGDRDRYWKLKNSLNDISEKDGKTCRWKMRGILSAALDAINSIEVADTNRIVAWGFCLGGHPVLELARMKCDGIKGLIAFHGIWSGAFKAETEPSPETEKKRPVLICNGQKDPWVSAADLDLAIQTFKKCGFSCNVLNFENVLHNFSNPRTEYDGEGFGYSQKASQESWESAIQFLTDIFEL
jgi:dienelactone hydrolase